MCETAIFRNVSEWFLVVITVCHCNLLHFRCHNSLSYPCWLGSSLDSWSDHALLCADTGQFERFCAAVFRSKGEEYKPYLATILRRTRTIDGNSLTLFWEFRVKN